MPERVLLHIGMHKTGSTSLQQFLRDHDADLLAEAGASFPPGFLLPTLHADLPLLTVRPEREWPARLRFPETKRASWRAAAEEHVRHQVRTSPADLLVYSHEDLSYLRSDDELEALRSLLAGRDVTVAVFLRERSAFLRSYGEQLEATGFTPSDDPSSFAYLRPDSWLVDHDALLGAYQGCFGIGNVVVFDYDDVVARDGSVIPVFADLVGIARSALPPLDGYFLNRSGMQVRAPDEVLAEIRRRLAQHLP